MKEIKYKTEIRFLVMLFLTSVFTTWMVSRVITSAMISFLPQACEMYYSAKSQEATTSADFSLYGPRI